MLTSRLHAFLSRLPFLFTVSFTVSLILSGCTNDSATRILGTLERDRIVLSATSSAIIVDVLIPEGSRVAEGDLILRLDDRKQRSVVAAAQAEVARSEAYLAELNNGARPEEIAAARARVASQKALSVEARNNYARISALVEKKILTQSDLDTALARQNSRSANLQNAKDKLQLLLKGTRVETLEQAEASLAKARAALQLEQQKLDELSLYATRDSWLDSLPRHKGERVAAGTPLAILLADNVPYARIYIPEPVRTRVSVGDNLTIYIDGVDRYFTGTLRQVALDPAFTPHYALNEKERAQLVYLAEVEPTPVSRRPANRHSGSGGVTLMSGLAIRAEGLTRRFGDFTAVNNLDLMIQENTIYGFLGPNGCGKSTTMRLLTGLLTPSAGQIEVLGMDIPKDSAALRRRLGYMTQKFSLYDNLSVEENLKFIARIYNLPARTSKSRIEQQLSEYGLNQHRKRLAGSLSGGQRQRLALSAATLHQPELLLLDEPTSAVDPENRRDFWETLFDLCEQNTTILVSTHYMDEAERCHGLAILESGCKRADDAPKALLENLGAHVLEVDGDNLRQVKSTLEPVAEILSTAQQGTHLRVLVDEHISLPEQWLRQQHPGLMAERTIRQVRPSLEDVFVQCTRQKESTGQNKRQ